MRHEEEGEALNPETTRAFLRVHAEREARAQAPPPDAPTVADLAESLGMPLEEARSILREARSRVVGEAAVAGETEAVGQNPTVGGRTLAWTFLGAGVLLLGTLLTSFRTAPAPSSASETIPLVTPAQMATPDPFMTPYAPGAAVTNVDRLANGFEISVASDTTTVTEPGTPPGYGTSYRKAEFASAWAVRERLAQRIVDLVKRSDAEGVFVNARVLNVGLRVGGGKTTTLRVPVPPYAFPLTGNAGAEEALRRSVEDALEAGWPAIVDATPQ